MKTLKRYIAATGPWLRALRHITPTQVAARVDYALRKIYYLSPFYPFVEHEMEVPDKPILTPPSLWTTNQGQGKNMLQRTFTFEGRELAMGENFQWAPPQMPTSWLEQLHGFSWLKDLRALKSEEARRLARAAIADWIENAGEFHPLRWHPHVLSNRLIHWLEHADWLLEDVDREFRRLFMISLSRQANHLPKVLEWGLGGHRLMRNIRALITVGLCLPNRQSTYLESLDLLKEQLSIQILHDGVHVQRSPFYHARVLKDLLDIHALILKAGQHPPAELDDVIDRMATALQFLRHTDGGLALFNEGGLGNSQALNELIKRCGSTGKLPRELPYAGYVRLQQGPLSLIFDAGALGPKHQYAHAHADALSFELSVGDERVFCNSGSSIPQHPQADNFRQTSAHNAIVVNGESSAEMLARQQVGRRPQRLTCRVREEVGTGAGVEATHDGYRHLNATCSRRLFLSDDGYDLRGEDCVEARKNYPVTVHFHLHPLVSYKVLDPHQAELTTPRGQKLLFRVKGGTLYDTESFYAPAYGQVIKRQQLVIRGSWQNGKCLLNWGLKVK